MKTSLILRDKMLATAVASLETPIITPTWERFIEFQRFDDTPLCRVRYESLASVPSVGDEVAYAFLAPDGTTTLRGIVDLASGEVAKFFIAGDTGDVLIGSVGGIGTHTDIRFNTVDWILDTTVITLENLRLVLPQGT